MSTIEQPGSPAEAPHATSPFRTWSDSTLSVFQFPAYRVLWLGNFFFAFAFLMSRTAQAVVAFDLTGDNGAVGLVIAGQGVSMLLCLPFGGAIADRVSKRRLIMLAQTVIASVMLTTAVLLRLDQITIALLALGTLLMGTMFAIYVPTRSALVAVTVPQERRGKAVALLQAGGNFGQIIGPFFAGLLLSISLVGSSGTYFMISAIFLLVSLTMTRMPEGESQAGKSETSVIEDLRTGVRYVWDNPRLRHMVLTFHLVVVTGLSYNVIMPGFAKEVLDSGNAGLGLLYGVASAGGLGMSIVVAMLADSKRAPLFLVITSFAGGIALILAGMAPTLTLAAVAMFIASGGVSSFHTLSNALTMGIAQPAYYGRVLSLMFMALAISNTLALPVGLAADHFGERSTLSGVGVILCIIVVLTTITRPKDGRPADVIE